MKSGVTSFGRLRKTKLEASPSEESPIEEIDFDPKTIELEVRTEYGDARSEMPKNSKVETLRTLPSFLGDYAAHSDIQKLPSLKLEPPLMLDVENLSALMAAPIQCTLPLANVLKVRIDLWKDVGKCLRKMGIMVPVSNSIPNIKEEKGNKVFKNWCH